MADYISRESILAKLKAKFCAYCPLPDCDANCKLHYLLDAVKEAPAADVVEVVRCKDCVYYNTTGCAVGFGWCEEPTVSNGVDDNYYCAGGERRSDNGKTT